MEHAALAQYARTHGQPIHDSLGRISYRCAARLTDGLYLPCVVLASAEARVDQAIRRFDEIRAEARPRLLRARRAASGWSYRDMVQRFVATGNCINHYDIAEVEPSVFAMPQERLAELQGETSMAWTQFAAVMRDGKEFSFGTTFLVEFFRMPEGYRGDDVVQVISHKRGDGELYRERPFLTCYIESL